MKLARIIGGLLVVIATLGVASPGAGAAPKTESVAITWQSSGGVLTPTATTTKHGSTYADAWSSSPSVAMSPTTARDTSVPDQTTYVATATVSASSLSAGQSYTFTYTITMTASGSGTTWVGTNSVTIPVGPDGTAPPPPGGSGTNV